MVLHSHIGTRTQVAFSPSHRIKTSIVVLSIGMESLQDFGESSQPKQYMWHYMFQVTHKRKKQQGFKLIGEKG